MKKNIIFFALAAMVALASCSVTRPYDITNNAIGIKTGTSSTVCILALLPVDVYSHYSSAGIAFNKNYGIKEAATNGKITKIGAVDLKITDYILFKKFTLIVSGE